MELDTFVGSPQRFKERVVERLESGRLDFLDQMRCVEARRKAGEKAAASAVLLPLEFDSVRGEYAVVLNKRSIYVQQAGDLCFPGGGTDRRLDGLLRRLLAWRLFPVERTGPFQKVLRSPPSEKEAFLFVLAAVLRECWEEMRLPPWKIEYMGALPSLWMQSFPRVIFPVVGGVGSGWKARPNREVESLLRVPLRVFFDPENYAICRFFVGAPTGQGETGHPWEYPCLVVNGPAGEEILWGATFRILMNFLERVFGLSVDEIHPSRKISKELPPYYFTGRKRATSG